MDFFVFCNIKYLLVELVVLVNFYSLSFCSMHGHLEGNDCWVLLTSHSEFTFDYTVLNKHYSSVWNGKELGFWWWVYFPEFWTFIIGYQYCWFRRGFTSFILKKKNELLQLCASYPFKSEWNSLRNTQSSIAQVFFLKTALYLGVQWKCSVFSFHYVKL